MYTPGVSDYKVVLVFKVATMREGFVTFVQRELVRIKCRVKFVYIFTQANFALQKISLIFG